MPGPYLVARGESVVPPESPCIVCKTFFDDAVHIPELGHVVAKVKIIRYPNPAVVKAKVTPLG